MLQILPKGRIYTSHELRNDSTFGMLPWTKSLTLERLSSFPFLLVPWVLAISQDENQGRSPCEQRTFYWTCAQGNQHGKWEEMGGFPREAETEFWKGARQEENCFRHVEVEFLGPCSVWLHASLCLTCLISILNLHSLEWFSALK